MIFVSRFLQPLSDSATISDQIVNRKVMLVLSYGMRLQRCCCGPRWRCHPRWISCLAEPSCLRTPHSENGDNAASNILAGCILVRRRSRGASGRAAWRLAHWREEEEETTRVKQPAWRFLPLPASFRHALCNGRKLRQGEHMASGSACCRITAHRFSAHVHFRAFKRRGRHAAVVLE